jgi:NodT family efflux transporter outer membrane factor (OMF) lipoprotein
MTTPKTNSSDHTQGITRQSLIVSLTLVLAACSGMPYETPSISLPAQFKEAPGGWKNAEPTHAQAGNALWQVFADPQLNELITQVDAANQNLLVAEARWRQATALASQAQASLFPTVSADAAATRASSTSSGYTKTTTTNTLQGSLSASWEIDLWGGLHDQAREQEATAQASLADLANTRLSLESTLATDYFALRVADAQAALLNASVKAYADSLALTRNRYAAGVASRSDVSSAETQWYAARTDAEDNAITRAQLEHAIAVLIGKDPSGFSLATLKTVTESAPASLLPAKLPTIPPALPSDLLERRPDIATAERQVAAANAGIGVARAALFPKLTLSATDGARGSNLNNLLGLTHRFWSLGPDLAGTIFDAGARRAAVNQAQANYEATVANYRQTVLTALQSVEDQLVALRVLENEAGLQEQTVRASTQTVTLTLNQYKAGTVPYLNVLTAQTTDQTAQRTALTIRGRQLAATVQLIKALGGSWQEEKPTR